MRLIYTFMISVLSIALTGCGIVQSAYEGTVDLSNSVFSWDIRTIHLDITARAELNMDDDNLSSPVVIRIYQLKNADMFNSVFYEDLVNQDSDALKESLLESKELILKPNTSLSVDIPFDKKADVVGIAALYKAPNLKENSWRLVLKRSDLNIVKPREIIASQYTITLQDESK
ncbi:MAG: type VI secretion system lipoprotein TssJ [Gilliamella apicola]|nr:type VI secretion system lipoprotein TssJ [Gilliamella apicola]